MKTTALLLALLALPASGDWIWTPEDGWINTKYAGRETAGPGFREGMALHQAGQHAEAARAFARVLETGVAGKLREDALYYAAESEYAAGDYYQAHVHYDTLLEEYPATERIRQIAAQEFEIGLAIVRGEKKEFLLLFKVTSKEEGVAILRRVLERYPTGEFADDARYTIANFYFQEGRYLEAMEEYRILRESEEFKTSEWRQIAIYQIARCEEAEYGGPRYDTTPISDSKKSYQKYLDEGPGSKAGEVKERLVAIDVDLAEADLKKAKWYLQWGRPKAAAVYLGDIVDLYPGTPIASEAQALLDEIGADLPDIPRR